MDADVKEICLVETHSQEPPRIVQQAHRCALYERPDLATLAQLLTLDKISAVRLEPQETCERKFDNAVFSV